MKLLVIQLRRIGDILLTTPAVSYLKQIFPEAEIHFLTEAVGKSVLETNPMIKKLIVYDAQQQFHMISTIRSEKYDVLFDFMNNPRSGWLSFLSGAKSKVGWKSPLRQFFYSCPISIPDSPEYVPLRKIRMIQSWLKSVNHQVEIPNDVRPKIYLTEHDKKVASDWMTQEKISTKEFVIFAPASRHSSRRWQNESFRQLGLDLVSKIRKKVYLAWGPGEEKQMADIRAGSENKIGLLPLTSIREMAAIYAQAVLVVTTDSGSLHTAVSMDTPTVSLHGPTRPIDWSPALAGAGKNDIPLNASEVECLGCHLHECPIGHLCMKNLTVERVFMACEKILTTLGEKNG